MKKHLSISELAKLSALGNFPVERIKQWFENRRHFENSYKTKDLIMEDQPEIIEII